MKKGLAVLLVFGLLLMGVTPVLAAREQVKAALPVQHDEAVQVVVPEGDGIPDNELNETQGECGACVLVGAASGALASGASEAYRQLAKYGRVVDWKSVANEAAIGAFVGGVTEAAVVGTMIKAGYKVAFNAVEAVASSVRGFVSGALNGWIHGR